MEEKPKKDQTAKEIAEIMAENMRANMADPEFLTKQALIRAKVRKQVIKDREERRKKEVQHPSAEE